jgi:hypothetical protein
LRLYAHYIVSNQPASHQINPRQTFENRKLTQT